MNVDLFVLLALGAIGVGLLTVLLVRVTIRRRASRLYAQFTDDMRIDLPTGVTYEKLAKFVIEKALRSVPDDETERQLVREFFLSSDDAAFVRDRVFGGVVRAVFALAGDRRNHPDAKKDPLATESFKLVMAEPAMARRIYPQWPPANSAA